MLHTVSRAEERKGTWERTKPSQVLYIEISLQGVTVNREKNVMLQSVHILATKND